MAVMTLVEAVNHTLHQEMERDGRVLVFGIEDDEAADDLDHGRVVAARVHRSPTHARDGHEGRGDRSRLHAHVVRRREDPLALVPAHPRSARDLDGTGLGRGRRRR